MQDINYFCNPDTIEANASEQVRRYAQNPHILRVCAFTDIHFCDEKAVPVGVAFSTKGYFYPLITGKDIGCGVMYLQIAKSDWLKPFNKNEHYRALNYAHTAMTDDGLGGGNHFLSLEEDENNVYVLCHTGTRDRGIGLYQQCRALVQEYSQECGREVEFVERSFVKPDFFRYYDATLRFGYERRKNFCLKTLIFLQNANYVRCQKSAIPKNYLSTNYAATEHEGSLYGTHYRLSDSVHNHLRFDASEEIIHRKGSTELHSGETVVIPLSMTRGSLFVRLQSPQQAQTALFSCSHGAGRRLSRFDTVKYWKTLLKEKERRTFKERFAEMLDRSGNFPIGYIQEFDFAYKDHSEIFSYQPYLKKITETKPIVTIKYTEI